jgi:uncharacterized protein YecE (DUF72 family)
MHKIRDSQAKRAFIYFNNTIGGHAIHNCIQLRQLLGKEDNLRVGYLPG